MEVVVTAVGPDNVGLADPIIHDLTGRGANIDEIQMYNHDDAAIFAMMCRVHVAAEQFIPIQESMAGIGLRKELQVRVWSPEQRSARPRLAICTTLLEATPRAVLEAISSGLIPAEPALVIGNRDRCRKLAVEFGIPWESIGRDDGSADDDRMCRLLDEYQIDYVILARYMRILPPDTCWKFAGGRIVNLHHGLLPSFPGLRPYHDAFNARMLAFGATCHFIVPELDAGNQTIHQSTFAVLPGTKLDEVIRVGQEENEPRCLVEGVRRVVTREVVLHFHRVIANPRLS